MYLNYCYYLIKRTLVLLVLLVLVSPWSHASPFVEFGVSPSTHFLSVKNSLSTRSQFFFGDEMSLSLGWQFELFQVSAILKTGELEYSFDTQFQKIDQSQVGIAAGMRFLENFSGGLQVLKNQIDIKSNTGTLIGQYEGMVFQLYVEGRYSFYKSLYALLRISYLVPGTLGSANTSTVGDLNIEGQSLKLGLGYQF